MTLTALGLLGGNNYFRIPFYKYQRKNEIKQLILEIAATENNHSSQITAMSTQVEDKKGNAIDEGDRVFTKFRGGKREGEASLYLEYYLTYF